jgi:sigma-E factor negative regulatory protein RseC
MGQDIRHDGVIDSIEGRHIRVKVIQTSACAACKIAGHCSASESKEKMIDVYTDPARFHVGQPVVVSTSASVVRRALLLGFGLPLLLLLCVLAICLLSGGSEEKAGLAALVSLVPYFAVIWLLRDKVARQVSFSIY